MKYREIENLLLSHHAIIKKNGIDFLKPIFKQLGNPQNKLGTIIHVTGTNGKGSVCSYLDCALRACGYKTALYTSPHIFSMRERIKFNGREISEKEFEHIFEKAYPYCKDLTFFETLTVMGFCWFAEKKPDFSIIEVGIGGLYDTTNIVENTAICLITSIGLDHTDLLGKSPIDIAFQKAGITKKDSLCIYPPVSDQVAKKIRKTVLLRGGVARQARDIFNKKEVLIKEGYLNLHSKKRGIFRVSLIGEKQGLNVSMALMALDALKKDFPLIKESHIKKGISLSKLSARFQLVRKKIYGREKLFIIDGAHNPQAIESLNKTLEMSGIKPQSLIFSIINTKDYKSILRLLPDFRDKIIFTGVNSIKAMDPVILADEYQKINSKADMEVIQDPYIAIKSAIESSDIILICGSFYLSAKCLEILGRNK